MATKLTLPSRRFVARVNTGTPEAKANYKALAQRNALALEECPWGEVTDEAVKPSLVEHDFTATFSDEKYDAFCMTGSYNSAENTEVAYAGMVAYRFTLPQDYLTGSATLVAASVMLSRDRFLLPGLRVSAVLSNSAVPSTSWDVVRGDAEGCVKLAEQLANPAERITAAEQATDAVEVGLTGLDSDKKAYLWIYLTVEDYTATWTWYSSTQHRLYAIEGSGMVVAESSTVEFSADVAPDAPGETTISFPVVRHGMTQSNFGEVSGMYGVAVLANGDCFSDLEVVDVGGNRKYDLPDSLVDFYRQAEDSAASVYHIGLRALYAKFYGGALEAAEHPPAGNLRRGAGFVVRPRSWIVQRLNDGPVTIKGWSLSASSIAIPFSLPSSFAADRMTMTWGSGGNTTGGTVNGGKYNFWLRRDTYVDELPAGLLKNPDIYVGDKKVVDGWEFLCRGDGGSVDVELDEPLTGRVATILVTAFVDQSASIDDERDGFRPRGASTEFEILPAAVRELSADTTGLATNPEVLMKPDITLYGRSDTYDGGCWTAEEVTIPNPLCFTAEQAGSTVAMQAGGTGAPSISLLTSTDGVNWSPFVVGETTITLANVGDKVYFAAGPGGNRSTSSDIYSSETSNMFVLSGLVAASGDISSLLNGVDTIPDLTGRDDYCLSWLFKDCTSLTSAPTLPAVRLAKGCYYAMFYGCTSMTRAPALPATTLALHCYMNMFKNCTSLADAPALPATTLATNCYNGMFYGCTSLTRAPTLPATTLATSCYSYMFFDCTSLVYITTHQTSLLNCTAWASHVAASGTFVCPAELGTNETITRGIDACPEGWTVINFETPTGTTP